MSSSSHPARTPEPGTSVPGSVAFGDVATRRTDLPNGLRVVTEAMPGVRSVALGVWVGVGSRDEPDALAGVSHFLEHLLFKGTAQRSARALAESIDAVGGEMNAFTAREHTVFYLRLPAHAARLGLEVLGDVCTAPSLRAADVDAERRVILEEIALDADDPEEQLHLLGNRALFGDHPLGRDVAGTAATVRGIGAGDVRAFFERWYRPANLVVAAAGAIDHDDVVDQVAERFGHLDTGERPERAVPPTPLAGHHHREMPVEQTHLLIGTAGPGAHDPDRYAATLLAHVLGGGMSSRLFQRIREERGLVYNVYAERSSYADAGAFWCGAGTSPDHVDEVRSLLAAELDAIGTVGVTERELEIARGYFRGATLLSLEDPASRMARLGTMLLTDDAVTGVDATIAQLMAVETAQLDALAARLASAPRVAISVGGYGGRP